jgi:hypothetical protein
MSMTNVFSSDFYTKSQIEREMEYSAKTRLPLHSPLLYNLHSCLFVPFGEKVKGLTKSLFLAINAKGGESISPKQKDHTTTNFKFFEIKFSIGYEFSNWYLKIFDLLSIGKTLLNTKRRI